MTFSELQALTIAATTCPRCGNGPGLRCSTKTGRRATYLHSARSRPMYAAWNGGFDEGIDEILRNPEEQVPMWERIRERQAARA